MGFQVSTEWWQSRRCGDSGRQTIPGPGAGGTERSVTIVDLRVAGTTNADELEDLKRCRDSNWTFGPSRWSPELFEKGIMTMTLCYNNRPPTLSLIPVIYNSLGQNKSKKLELWPNNEYGIRPYSFQKFLRVQLTVVQNQRRIKVYRMGLAGEGVWGMEMAQLLVGR